jgi:hypothetical protein
LEKEQVAVPPAGRGTTCCLNLFDKTMTVWQ